MPALVGLAENKAKTGQIDEALEDYRLILKLRNAPPSASLRFARLLYKKNMDLPEPERNWEQVERALDHAARTNPETSEVAILRAKVLVAQDSVARAVTLLTETRDQLVKETQTVRDRRLAVLAGADKLPAERKAEKLADAEKLLTAARGQRILRLRSLAGSDRPFRARQGLGTGQAGTRLGREAIGR